MIPSVSGQGRQGWRFWLDLLATAVWTGVLWGLLLCGVAAFVGLAVYGAFTLGRAL